MAGYGLKVFDSGGSLILDLTDTITRLRYSNEVNGGVSDNVVLSDIAGKSTAEFGIGLEAAKTAHGVTRSGTTISWTARGSTYRPSGKTLILVFLYD